MDHGALHNELKSEEHRAAVRGLHDLDRRGLLQGGQLFEKPGLVPRDPEGVQDMVEATIANSPALLARSWRGMGQGPRLPPPTRP